MRYNMTDKEIRQEIENMCYICETVKAKKTINGCFMCIRDKLVTVRKELIKERKLSAAKQETIDNFILGRREE
jgi:hypothetical protein